MEFKNLQRFKKDNTEEEGVQETAPLTGLSRFKKTEPADQPTTGLERFRKTSEPVVETPTSAPSALDRFKYKKTSTGLREGMTMDDLIESPEAMTVVKDFMGARFGSTALEDVSDEKLVDQFLNEMRGRAAGNTYRTVSAFQRGRSANEEDLAKMAAGQELFDSMASIWNKNNTWWETLEGLGDYTRSAILDPVNVVSLGVGSAVGKSVAAKALPKALTATQVRKEAFKQAAVKGGGEAAFKSAHKKLISKNMQNLAVRTKAVGDAMRNSTAIQKVFSKAGLAEVATSTVIDAIGQTGSAYIDQLYLQDIGSQEGIDKWSVGIAALSTLAMGGLSAATVGSKGWSKTALLSDVELADPSVALKKMNESIFEHQKKVTEAGVKRSNKSWLSSVEQGRTLGQVDSQSVMNLLFGQVDGDTLVEKGLFHALAENGYRWVKNSEDDKITEWLTDFIRIADQSDVTDTARMLGIKNPETVTADQLADQLAYTVSVASSMMNNLGQISKVLGTRLDPEDVFADSALEMGAVKSARKKIKSTKLGMVSADFQNKAIRLLVSHPGTTFLNVKGYLLNTGLNTVKDISLGATKLVGNAESRRVGKHMLKSALGRTKLFFDPNMTAAAFDSIAARNMSETKSLTSVLSGGVDDASVLMSGGRISTGADAVIDRIQDLTFVHKQDHWTKSQEMMYQLDKNARITFNKSWNELVNSPDANRLIASEQFSDMVRAAADTTQEMIFSKSYKNGTHLGKVAGIIEDFRSIAGVGTMLPFGRFFNNTVDFGMQWSGLALPAKLLGKYDDKSYKELAMKGAIGVGLVYTMIDVEKENREKGIGFGQRYNSMTGGVDDVLYDYPESLFRGVARLLSYIDDPDGVPLSEVGRFVTEFLGGSLLRTPENTAKEIGAVFTKAIEGNGDLAEDTATIAGAMASQLIGGSLRFMEPVDVAIGIAGGAELAPSVPMKSEYSGPFNAKATQNALRYVDNIREVFFGNEPIVAAGVAEGERAPALSKSLGKREVVLTNLQRVINMTGNNAWEHNLDRKVREAMPQVANSVQLEMYTLLEEESEKLVNNPRFKNASRAGKEDYVKKMIKNVTSLAEQRVFQRTEDPLAAELMFDIVSSSPEKEVLGAINELGFGDKELYQLDRGQAIALRDHLKMKEFRTKQEVGFIAGGQ